MFLERFKEVENFTITKLPLGGSKKFLRNYECCLANLESKYAIFRNVRMDVCVSVYATNFNEGSFFLDLAYTIVYFCQNRFFCSL